MTGARPEGYLLQLAYERFGWRTWRHVDGNIWTTCPGWIARRYVDTSGTEWRLVVAVSHPRSGRKTIRTPSRDLIEFMVSLPDENSPNLTAC